MRDTKPTEDYIEKLKRELEIRYSPQDKRDQSRLELYKQTHVRNMWEPKQKKTEQETELVPVGAGLAGFMIDQDVSVLNGEPTIRVNSPGNLRKGEQHASQKLEPWLVSARKSARRRSPIQVLKTQDLRMYGRAWTEVLPAPEMWGIERGKNESDEKFIEREQGVRKNTPIIWRWVSARRTWPVFDDYRIVNEVLQIRKLPARVVKDRWGIDTKNTTEVEVVYYTNHVWTATYVVDGDKGKVVHSWEHGMDGLPMVLFEGDPMPEDPQGEQIYWRSALDHADSLIRSIDDTLSDIRTVSRKAAIAGVVVKQDPDLRADQAGETEDIEIKDNETTVLFKTEDIFQLQTAQLNPALLSFVTLAKGLLDQIALSRPALAGALSGQSAVALETAAQRAEAELRASHQSLEDGAEQECVLFFRAVKALSKKFPSSPDAVTVSPASPKYGRTEISVTPDDTEGYDHLIQASLQQNIPMDEGQATVNYSVAIKSGALSAQSGRERYYRHEDPIGEQDKIDKEMMRALMVQALGTLGVQFAMGGAEQEGALPSEEVAERAQDISPEAQEVLAGMFEGDGDAEMANLLRGRMNAARVTRGQNRSQMSASATLP